MVSNPHWLAYVTYAIYIVIFETVIIGGTMYAVFALGHSGWWLLGATFLGFCAYSPRKWIYGDLSAEDRK